MKKKQRSWKRRRGRVKMTSLNSLHPHNPLSPSVCTVTIHPQPLTKVVSFTAPPEPSHHHKQCHTSVASHTHNFVVARIIGHLFWYSHSFFVMTFVLIWGDGCLLFDWVIIVVVVFVHLERPWVTLFWWVKCII